MSEVQLLEMCFGEVQVHKMVGSSACTAMAKIRAQGKTSNLLQADRLLRCMRSAL